MVQGGEAGGTGLRLAAVLVLVLINGFFVAAEFGLVAVRRSRIDQLAEEGDRGAERVQRALAHLDLSLPVHTFTLGTQPVDRVAHCLQSKRADIRAVGVAEID